MAKTMLISAQTGSYEKGGEQKNTYSTIGKLFVKDDGSMFGKIETLPIDKNWDGMFNIFEIKKNDEKKDKKDDLPF